MKVLVTGSRGFVGKNLVEALKALQTGKDRTRPGLKIDWVYEYGRNTPEQEWKEACASADFVFHLAGVNRTADPQDFAEGNVELTRSLLQTLEQMDNPCPVMLASSIQATLLDRYAGSPYGRTKRQGEELVAEYGKRTGARTLIYRLPNLFGKWCRPNYNSVVATFCHHIARDLPIEIRDPEAELELAYIDDLVAELLDGLEGREHRCTFSGLKAIPEPSGPYCYVPVTHRVTLGEIAELLHQFRAVPDTHRMPEIPAGSFSKKLYSTYLSYLPPERVAIPLCMHTDARGSFTELVKTRACGQFSVNISKPGVTKGQHWHNSKWELFVVVSGKGLIQQREIGTGNVLNFPVSGDKIEAIQVLPGFTHNIVNLSETENLITVMWANEPFDPARPDTYAEPVEPSC